MIFIQKLRVQIVNKPIATVRDHFLTFGSFLTPIVSRFHLPLIIPPILYLQLVDYFCFRVCSGYQSEVKIFYAIIAYVH
jgi:hypothetical protein